MIELKNLTLQRGSKLLLDKANLTVSPQRRVGLVGRNGTGKSSLFALIKGEIAQDGGDVLLPAHWKLASVAQETPALDISALDYVLRGDGELQLFQTALHEAEVKNDGMKQAEYHAKLEEIDAYSAPARAAKLLSGLGFSQEEHGRPVKSFSGGWRMRLNLAQALMCRADLLLLDEPTNHLDLDMRHALTLALQSFQGALIVVSHDRSLLEATTDSFLLIEQGRLKTFDGDLEDYRRYRLAQENAAAAPAASAQSRNRRDAKRVEAQIRQEKARLGKPLQQKIDQAEKEMAALGEIQTACEAFLAQEDAYSDANKAKLQQTLAQLAETKVKLSELEESWLGWQEELEQILAQIDAQYAQTAP